MTEVYDGFRGVIRSLALRSDQTNRIAFHLVLSDVNDLLRFVQANPASLAVTAADHE